MKKIVPVLFSTLVFIGLFLFLSQFFKSEMMKQFIWDMNTFHGMFANLPTDLPKENIFGSYAFAFKDYFLHLPNSVDQNSVYYSVLLASAVSLCIFRPQHFSLLAIVVFGLFARFFFAYHTTCNHDMVSWYIDKSILDTGGNVFAETDRYNYSPFWFLVLKGLGFINHLLPQFSFMFMVRSFLTLIDLATLIVLMFIAKEISVSGLKAAALFFLNPVSIIITGYHGQFDNIPVLFVLLAIYAFLKQGSQSLFRGWLLVTVGMIAKHEILQQILIYLKQFPIKNRKVLFLFTLSVLLFSLTFLPYWAEGQERIVKNVLRYGGMSRPYGLIHFHVSDMAVLIHKFLFISLLLIWPFIYKTQNLVKSSLIGMLFFLVFSSGISTQQFILPIALGALYPNMGFALFTTAVSFFLFGDLDELKIAFFKGMSWNYIWFCAVIWFLMELKPQPVQKSAKLVHVT